MDSMYTTFKCEGCKRTNIAITKEYQEAKRDKKYLACMYCNSKHLKNKSPTDNLLECFKNSECRR